MVFVAVDSIILCTNFEEEGVPGDKAHPLEGYCWTPLKL